MKYICNTCKKTYKRKHHYEKHIKDCDLYKCDKCGKEFEYKSKYDVHMKRKTTCALILEKIDSDKACKYCYRTYSCLYSKNRHESKCPAKELVISIKSNMQNNIMAKDIINSSVFNVGNNNSGVIGNNNNITTYNITMILNNSPELTEKICPFTDPKLNDSIMSKLKCICDNYDGKNSTQLLGDVLELIHGNELVNKSIYNTSRDRNVALLPDQKTELGKKWNPIYPKQIKKQIMSYIPPTIKITNVKEKYKTNTLYKNRNDLIKHLNGTAKEVINYTKYHNKYSSDIHKDVISKYENDGITLEDALTYVIKKLYVDVPREDQNLQYNKDEDSLYSFDGDKWIKTELDICFGISIASIFKQRDIDDHMQHVKDLLPIYDP